MAEAQTQAPQTQAAPIQVQVVPGADPEAAAHERFAEKLARMESAPTMQPGDRQPRRFQDRIPGVTPDASQPAPQQEAPATETPVATDATPAEEEHYEFEFSGGRYQVPKELKEMHDGYLRQQDYTQKQQELAELRRSAEAMMQQSRQQQELHQALAPQVAQLNSINERLAQYGKLDWNQLFQQDANAAQQHSVQFSVLNNQKQMLEREIQQTAQSHMAKITEAQAKALEASDKAMAQKVKGWTRDTAKQVNEFARKAYGFTENEVNSTLDPRALEMMHDAKQWRDLQSSKAQKVVTPQKTLKPAAAEGPANTPAQKVSELRKGFRTAKTDGQRDAIAQQILMQRLR